MTVFIVRNYYGEILGVTKTYETAVTFCCESSFKSDSIFIQPIIEVFVKAGCERFEELWEELNRNESFSIEEYGVN